MKKNFYLTFSSMSSYHEKFDSVFFFLPICILCFCFLCNNFFNTGLGDPSGRDSLHIAEMVKELKQLEYINAFLILFNAQNPRLDESLRAMIDIFTQIFGRERFFDNVVLVFTRWEHSEKAERKRQRSGINYH